MSIDIKHFKVKSFVPLTPLDFYYFIIASDKTYKAKMPVEMIFLPRVRKFAHSFTSTRQPATASLLT